MSPAQKPQIISVTGTKGKSTIVYVLASILNASEKVLRVDTTGYYIDGKQQGTLSDSQRIAGLVPTVAPGRYLESMKEVEKFTAVLECALGCSGLAGLGYRHHDVGVFTNVLEDHIGSSQRLKTRKDIAEAKKFIFSRVKPGGCAVFNADDKLVCSMLKHVREGSVLIPCGLSFKHFNLKKHLSKGGTYVSVQDGWAVVASADKQSRIVKVKDVSWTFEGAYAPSVQNLLYIVGALWAHNGGRLPTAQRKLLKQSRLDPFGGRLTRLKTRTGIHILADYAHEKYSLASIGDLARTLADSPSNRVIGVVRLAYDRTDQLIKDTALHIKPHYDEFVVYDKIDGFWKKPKKTTGSFKMKTGYISGVLNSSLERAGAKTVRIVREDEAIEYASSIARPGDVVVIIVNDDIRRSIGFIKDKFKAKFI
jgi:UDP-N-acetylmuramyl tripeptide synthase